MQEMLVEFWDSGCVKHYKGNVTKKRQKLEADFGNVTVLRKNMEEETAKTKNGKDTN